MSSEDGELRHAQLSIRHPRLEDSFGDDTTTGSTSSAADEKLRAVSPAASSTTSDSLPRPTDEEDEPSRRKKRRHKQNKRHGGADWLGLSAKHPKPLPPRPVPAPTLSAQHPDRAMTPIPTTTKDVLETRNPIYNVLSIDPDEQSVAFCNELLALVNKANDVMERSLAAYEAYFHHTSKEWGKNCFHFTHYKDRAKKLHTEIVRLVAYADNSILAVLTAMRRFEDRVSPELRAEVLQEHVLIGPLSRNANNADVLRKNIEFVYAEAFTKGDTTQAHQELSGRAYSPALLFSCGFFCALVLSASAYWFHMSRSVVHRKAFDQIFSPSFPILRFMLSITAAICGYGVALFVVIRHRINYLYIFELPQVQSATPTHIIDVGLCSMFLVLCAGIVEVLYPGSLQWSFPLLFFGAVAVILFPIKHVLGNTRAAFFQVLRNLVILPFGTVKFIDFFVADWGTSLVIPLMDTVYVACYYTNFDIASVCWTNRNDYGFVVALIPYLWRAMQTLLMFHRTRVGAHLINFGKYVSCCSFIFYNRPHTISGTSLWWLHLGSQLYAYAWDILMDWGWIRGKSRGTAFSNSGVYIGASVLDLCGRLFYLAAATYGPASPLDPGAILMVQALVEVSRRSMWSVFRLENENLNNLEKYRTVEYVPPVVVQADGDGMERTMPVAQHARHHYMLLQKREGSRSPEAMLERGKSVADLNVFDVPERSPLVRGPRTALPATNTVDYGTIQIPFEPIPGTEFTPAQFTPPVSPVPEVPTTTSKRGGAHGQ